MRFEVRPSVTKAGSYHVRRHGSHYTHWLFVSRPRIPNRHMPKRGIRASPRVRQKPVAAAVLHGGSHVRAVPVSRAGRRDRYLHTRQSRRLRLPKLDIPLHQRSSLPATSRVSRCVDELSTHALPRLQKTLNLKRDAKGAS